MVIDILVSSVIAGRFIFATGFYTVILIPASLLVIAGIAIRLSSPHHQSDCRHPRYFCLGLALGSVGTSFIAAQAVLEINNNSAKKGLMTLSQDVEDAVFVSAAQ